MLLDRVHPARLHEALVASLCALGLIDAPSVVDIETRRLAAGFRLSDREQETALLLRDELGRVAELWPRCEHVREHEAVAALDALPPEDRRVGLLLMLARMMASTVDDAALLWESHDLISALDGAGRFTRLTELEPARGWRRLLPFRGEPLEPFRVRLQALMVEEAAALGVPA